VAIITGTSGNNRLTGTSGDDEIDGLDGNDVIDGGGGDDQVYGGWGFDTLAGGTGNDIISDVESGSAQGGDGDDSIIFGLWVDGHSYVADAGNDNDSIAVSMFDGTRATVKGGAGSDRISIGTMLGTLDVALGTARDVLEFTEGFRDLTGFVALRSGGITVSDFVPGAKGDIVDWELFLARSLVDWDQSANPFSNGFLRLRQSGKDSLLQFDPDGGGDGYLTLLVLKNVSKNAFTAANFQGYDPSGTHTSGRAIDGTDEFDELVGTLGNDVIRAFAADDLVYASGGGDSVYGGVGNDTLSGEIGHDKLYGEDGHDVLNGGFGNDRLEGGAGDDWVSGEVGNDILSGGAGNDNLYDYEGNDLLLGGDGDDVFDWTGEGSPRLEGGEGADRFRVSSFSESSDHLIVLGGGGNDVIDVTIPSQDTIFVDGGPGDDRIEFVGVGGLAHVLTGTGTDQINLNWLIAGVGWNLVLDDFTAGPDGDRLSFREALTSVLIGWNGRDNPFTSGFLRVSQVETSAILEFDADGDDFAYGFDTIAVFSNTRAADLTTENLGGFSAIPVRNGTSGSNTVKGTAGAERLNGLAGSDRLFGYAGEDILVGDSGDDHLDGGSGADAMYGGSGNDTYIVNSAADRLSERAGNNGTDRVESTASFTLPNHIEKLVLLGSAGLSGTGNDQANTIVGNSAANQLRGNGGNDRLDGGAGGDTMRGGLGDDTFVVDSASDLVYEDNRAGTDTIEASVDYQLPVQVERLVLTGTAPLAGRGNTANNWLYGNSGDNFLSGGQGDDRVEGGGGHDWIYGSLGRDVLVGGSGKDRFYFHTEPAAANADQIVDFSSRDDSIYLALYEFTELAGPGQLAASAFRLGTRAGDSNDRIVYDAVSGNLFYDADGSGSAAAILFATVTPGTSLGSADFIAYG
jgi:Ca2+-binding RTX toxin-like protein